MKLLIPAAHKTIIGKDIIKIDIDKNSVELWDIPVKSFFASDFYTKYFYFPYYYKEIKYSYIVHPYHLSDDDTRELTINYPNSLKISMVNLATRLLLTNDTYTFIVTNGKKILMGEGVIGSNLFKNRLEYTQDINDFCDILDKEEFSVIYSYDRLSSILDQTSNKKLSFPQNYLSKDTSPTFITFPKINLIERLRSLIFAGINFNRFSKKNLAHLYKLLKIDKKFKINSFSTKKAKEQLDSLITVMNNIIDTNISRFDLLQNNVFGSRLSCSRPEAYNYRIIEVQTAKRIKSLMYDSYAPDLSYGILEQFIVNNLFIPSLDSIINKISLQDKAFLLLTLYSVYLTRSNIATINYPTLIDSIKTPIICTKFQLSEKNYKKVMSSINYEIIHPMLETNTLEKDVSNLKSLLDKLKVKI